MYLWSGKKLLNSGSHLPPDPDTRIFLKNSSTLPYRAFFHNLANFPSESDQIFVKILSPRQITVISAINSQLKENQLCRREYSIYCYLIVLMSLTSHHTMSRHVRSLRRQTELVSRQLP